MAQAQSIAALSAGNVAVVTGGASGIGLACARQFAARGLKVCLADVEEGALRQAVASFPDGAKILGQAMDVSNPASVDALFKVIATRWGPVSVLMNNAAIGAGGDVLGEAGSWERLMAVNLMGVFYGVNRFVPEMISSGRPGLVINTGSKQGITQPPGNTAYNVAKSGVKALTEGLAYTLREQTGDRISAHLLIPGFTYTGMTARRLSEKPPAAWTAEQVAGRLMEGLEKGEFYILCEDNETTRLQDEKRMAWHMGDIIENRPALSRWHPDYKAAFEAYMKS